MSRYRRYFLWVMAYSSASMIRSACWRRCLDWPPPVMDQLCSGTCRSCSKNVATLRTTSSMIVSVWTSSRTGCGRYAMLFSDENPRVENSIGIHENKRIKHAVRHAKFTGTLSTMNANKKRRRKSTRIRVPDAVDIVSHVAKHRLTKKSRKKPFQTNDY